MNKKRTTITILAVLVLLFGVTVTSAQKADLSYPNKIGGPDANPVGSAFTYQGRLAENGTPANGTYDFEFKLFDLAEDGDQVGNTVSIEDVEVSDGLFSVALDFGDVFDGTTLWLQIGVQPSSTADPYTTLNPRQKLTATPYANYASKAPWSGLLDIPAGFQDGIDDNTQLSELEIENFVTNGPLDLAEGTTLGGELIITSVTGGCESIQTAIDNLPPGGGVVILSTGTYTCTTAIVIDRDNIYLRGQGPGTILRLEDGSNSPVIVIGQTSTPITTTYRDIHLSDLVIDGNRVNQSLECWGGACDSGGTTYIRNNGVTLRGVSDVLVEQVKVYSARSGGLVSEKGCKRLTVRDFTAFDNHFDGLAAYETEESIFSGLHLYDNLAAGLSLDLDFNNNDIGDAVIANNESVGVFIIDARDNHFHDLQIRNSRHHGIFLAEGVTPDMIAYGNTFSGVVVSDSGQRADPATEGWCVDSFVGGVGICVNNDSAENNLVVGAQFINNFGGCIKEPVGGPLREFGTICR